MGKIESSLPAWLTSFVVSLLKPSDRSVSKSNRCARNGAAELAKCFGQRGNRRVGTGLSPSEPSDVVLVPSIYAASLLSKSALASGRVRGWRPTWHPAIPPQDAGDSAACGVDDAGDSAACGVDVAGGGFFWAELKAGAWSGGSSLRVRKNRSTEVTVRQITPMPPTIVGIMNICMKSKITAFFGSLGKYRTDTSLPSG